ncbi:MAG: ATP-binding protein [Ginsengibacter sp.]
MKKMFFLYLLFLTPFPESAGQDSQRDSLKQRLAFEESDTAKVNILYNIATSYIKFFIGYGSKDETDSAVAYVEKAILLSSRIRYSEGEARGFLTLSGYNRVIGNYSQSLSLGFKALHIYENLKDNASLANAHGHLLATYRDAGDYENALSHAFTEKKFVEKWNREQRLPMKDTFSMANVLSEIGIIYQYMNVLDSAEYYTRKSMSLNAILKGTSWNFPVYLLGIIKMNQGNYTEALKDYRTAIGLAISNGIPKDTLDIYNSMAELYKKVGDIDSSIYYSKAVTNKWASILFPKILLTACADLTEAYKLKSNTDSTLKYLELSNALRDSIYSNEKQKEFQNLTFIEQLTQQEMEQEQQQLRNRITIYFLVAGALVLLVIALLLYRNNLHKKQAKLKIEKAYDQLKSTQAQLIQSEKMASLGELTAGIAHEIQNPLNFVNNFSDVNTELIEELKNELQTGSKEEAISIANDIKENERKINHHGKRADAIVKNMLQHSRISTGQKEPTDINALADEYLRLAYHGLRAKDKTFNTAMKTEFDSSIEKVKIVSQDIGRVLLNLYNNAFYAVAEKNKSADKNYQPTVSVETKKLHDKIEITVKDNGNGIPQKVLDKIFQPFFTTKPTGQGTGLGLSLSYDIIKAHGGELKAETKEGEGAAFIIQFPNI